MAFGSIGTGAAKGYQWLQEQRLKAAQLAQQSNQAAMQDQLARDQMASREAMQTEQLNANAAEKDAQREHESALRVAGLDAEAANREEDRSLKRTQFEQERGDRLAQQQWANERQATLDEWKTRLDEEELAERDQRLQEAQERVRALTTKNDEQLRQNEEKKRLYETTPMELYISALETKGQDGNATGCNFPAANAEAAKVLGVKSIEYSGMDQNGIFVIKGVGNDGKPFIKQHSPEWMENAANYFYGDNNPVSAKGKSAREVEEYRQKRQIDQENYEKNRGARSVADFASRLSLLVAKEDLGDEEAQAALDVFKKIYGDTATPAPKPAPQPNQTATHAPTATPQGGAQTQTQTRTPASTNTSDRAAQIRAELERRRAAAAGGQNGAESGETHTRRIPGVGGNGVSQTQQTTAQGGQQTSAQNGGQQTQKPYNEMTRAERTAAVPDFKSVSSQYAQDGVDAGQIERAYNMARGQYVRGEANGMSFESLLLKQLQWQIKRSQRGQRGSRR